MEIKRLEYDFSVCKVVDYSQVDLNYLFLWSDHYCSGILKLSVVSSMPVNFILSILRKCLEKWQPVKNWSIIESVAGFKIYDKTGDGLWMCKLFLSLVFCDYFALDFPGWNVEGKCLVSCFFQITYMLFYISG